METSTNVKNARVALMESVLVCSAEAGFDETSVERVCARAQVSRDLFQKSFDDKAQCFSAAYEWKADFLVNELQAIIAGEGSLKQRVDAALAAIAEFSIQEEAAAKALFVEVHRAGKGAAAIHDAVLSRLTETIEAACPARSADRPGYVTTAEFLVRGIEYGLSEAILNCAPDRFEAEIPELSTLVLQYITADQRSPAGT